MNGRIKRPEDTKQLQLPRIGKIKVGMKNEKGYPTSVDYFIATGKYAELFKQAYGEKPQTIQIVFLADDAQSVCLEEYEYRTDKGELVAKGDGETFKVWNGYKYIEMTTEQYPRLMTQVQEKYPNKAFQKSGDGWRVKLTLNFIIPLVRGVAGIWTFESNGNLSTIPQIRDCFDTLINERGYAKGVICDLNVKFATSQKPDSRSRYPVVTLVPNESRENLEKVVNARKPILLEEQKKVE